MTATTKPTLPLAILAGFLALAALAARRGAALLHPQVWDEDGVILIPDFLTHGWASLFAPYQLYLLTISRAITDIALTIAPQAYPAVSTLLAWLFTVAVVVFIALAPTLLRSGLWLAVACLLVPTEPEVFGTSLFASWWAGVPLLLLPFWERTNSHVALRGSVLAIGGLSSPLVAVAAPVFVLRAVLLRTRVESMLALLAVICATIQIGLVIAFGGAGAAPIPDFETLRLIVAKFFGWFVWDTSWGAGPNLWRPFVIGWPVLGATAFAAWRLRDDPFLAGGLLYLLASSIALAVARVDIATLHPIGGGARYFFYPYILMAWLMFAAARRPGAFLARATPIAVLICALVNTVVSGWSRDQADLEWQRHVASCAHFDDYAMPIQYDGQARLAWRHNYTREQCNTLGAAQSDIAAQDLFPFTVRLDRQPVLGTPRDVPPADRAHGDVRLTLNRGDRVPFQTSDTDAAGLRYRVETESGAFTGALPPCRLQCALEFASDLLPDTFGVILSSDPSRPQDWFTVER